MRLIYQGLERPREANFRMNRRGSLWDWNYCIPLEGDVVEAEKLGSHPSSTTPSSAASALLSCFRSDFCPDGGKTNLLRGVANTESGLGNLGSVDSAALGQLAAK